MKEQDIIEGDESLLRPDEEKIRDTTEKTKAALEQLVDRKMDSPRSYQVCLDQKGL